MNEKLFCIECKKYFINKEDWDKEHNKVYYKRKNIKHKHNFLIEGNVLSYIFDIMSKNSENEQRIIKQNIEIIKLQTKLNFYEDSLKNDVFFETNINIKNIENKIFGKCLIHFFPKSIYFKIECNGNINFDGNKEFELEIIFPFKNSELKFCTIEKLQGCLFSKKVQNTSDEETTIFSNYSSIVDQKNKLISVKLLRNYHIIESLKKNKINFSVNGTLTFADFGFHINDPFVLYNINQKRFLSYDKYQWKFIENCFTKDGKIKNECIVYLEFNFDSGEIYIKNDYNYIGNNGNFITKDKENAKFLFKFLNSFYGIITIVYNNKYLYPDIKSGLIRLSEESSYFMVINI